MDVYKDTFEGQKSPILSGKILSGKTSKDRKEDIDDIRNLPTEKLYSDQPIKTTEAQAASNSKLNLIQQSIPFGSQSQTTQGLPMDGTVDLDPHG